ncbi:MAG: hypothetical protein IKM39_04320, partial [Clostridia bacterium]|nr:hypothetical protein [Clostridia bacterium]
YGTDKTLQGVGFRFPFSFVGQWYDYQKEFMNKLDVTKQTQTPYYTEQVEVWDVMVNKKKTCLAADQTVCLYGDRLTFGGTGTLLFEDISSVAVLGRNKLNIYHGDNVWQLRGDKGFNALKYVHIYHRHKNISKGDTDGKFLGL